MRLDDAVRSTDTVSRVMTWPVAAVGTSATLREVAEALAANEVGAAVVLVGERLVGIISERDVTTHLAEGANPERLVAEEMVTYSPVTVAPYDSLRAAARLMVEARVRHLPVVDGDDVVGMVSLRDVTAALLDEAEGRGAV